MKRINLFWIIWIFVALEFKGIACVSYPGVYRSEPPVIIPGASPIENVFVTERYGINYECIETCYPILNICDDRCSIMPDLPECMQCQRLQAAQPTPIIIETPPYEPRPPPFEHSIQPIVPYPPRLPRPKPNVPRPVFQPPPLPIIPEIPRPPQFEMFEPVTPPTFILPDIPQPPKLENFQPDLPPQPIIPSVPTPPVFDLMQPESPPELNVYEVPPAPEIDDVFETELPPHTTQPDIPVAPTFEHFQPPRPIMPEIPRPPKFEMFEPVTPPTFILPDVPQSPIFEHQPELPHKPILPVVPRPPQFSPVLPTQTILPETLLPPKLETFYKPQPLLPEVLRPPQFETDLLPQSILSEMYPQFQLSEPRYPPAMIPLPPRFEQFEQELPPEPLFVDFPYYPMIDVFEPEVPAKVPVIQPPFPEIINPSYVQVPNLVSHEILVPNYPENVFYPEPILYFPEAQTIYDSEQAGLVVEKDIIRPPIVTEYQDICNDYCLLKRNISECEICLKTGVPADYLEHCSNCLVNPSEPDCELCYPILMNLCREFCIFEENEPDCSICYSQPLIELPVALTEQLIHIPALPLHTTMEYVVPAVHQEMCPGHCAHAPASPECAGCAMGVEVIEKVCVDICAGYCLENPDDKQCAVCLPTVLPDIVKISHGTAAAELPTLEVINYQCCYGDYCTPMPRNGVCPVVCKELCTTACSNDCFNPTCPDCQEVVALNELRRTQFMIWLKTKLSDMKSRYMTMIEACIRRTELMYERELQAIEMEVDTSFLLA